MRGKGAERARVLNRLRTDFQSRVVGQSAQDEQRILGLYAELLDLDFVVGHHAVAGEESAHVGGGGLFGGEKRIGEFLLEVAMQVEIRPVRVDQHASCIVVDEKWQMKAFAGNFHPLLVLALLLPFPDQSAEVETFALGDG